MGFRFLNQAFVALKRHSPNRGCEWAIWPIEMDRLHIYGLINDMNPVKKENPMTKTDLSRAFPSLLFVAVLAVTGCGGGSSGSGTTPAKSSFTAGPITSTGPGTVTVKGTSFNVSRASISDDEARARGEGDLKLGMQTQINAGEITTDATGSHCQASSIEISSAIIGPVDAIDTSTRLLVVLGQTIDVLDTTVFDDRFPEGPFSISVGNVLQIFGTLDATTGHYVATRIEPADDAPLFKLRGIVANLNSGARRFTIGGQIISFANLSNSEIPANLANGTEVTVKLQKAKVDGAWVAVEIKTPVRQVAEHNEIELKGRITDVTSPTQFSVAGIPVDASNATFHPGGVTVFWGADVEVEGMVTNGTVIATRVNIGNDDEHGNRHDSKDWNKHKNKKKHENENED